MFDDTDVPDWAEKSPRVIALARAIRAARGSMPQVEFAVHANRPQSVVSNWELGKQTPTLETLWALESSLGLPAGLLAAQAGYFTGEAAAAAALPGAPVSSLHYGDRSDALRAVAAADDLGLRVRMGSTSSGRWLVEVLQRGGATEVDDLDFQE